MVAAVGASVPSGLGCSGSIKHGAATCAGWSTKRCCKPWRSTQRKPLITSSIPSNPSLPTKLLSLISALTSPATSLPSMLPLSGA
ncbi:hypothetical protein Tsubulata_039252 [Turnera subulata]|uniref:Uncharacterized protein n=1 Tax=Turnera subulata TaxID=218843 RepID=A0A9Q0J0Q0_9ROSI|nr:hypothetical protein Tsubulata_039252 [Turnera subulata]